MAHCVMKTASDLKPGDLFIAPDIGISREVTINEIVFKGRYLRLCTRVVILAKIGTSNEIIKDEKRFVVPFLHVQYVSLANSLLAKSNVVTHTHFLGTDPLFIIPGSDNCD